MCPHPFVPMCVPIYEHVCPCTPNTQTQDIVLKLGVGGEGAGPVELRELGEQEGSW